MVPVFLSCRLTVASFDNLGHAKYIKTSGLKHLSLGKDEVSCTHLRLHRSTWHILLIRNRHLEYCQISCLLHTMFACLMNVKGPIQ